LAPPAAAAGDGVPLDLIAVNDVVFEKLVRDRQVSVALYLDGKAFASYSADALVVASPTGSTAYSFAAGGPIVSPRLNAIVFTPVAPHMVFDRSIVLAGDEVAAVKVLPKSGPVAVSVDGQLRGVLDPGDWMAVRAAPWRARLVRLHRMDFYGRMRERFGLSDAPAAVADGGGDATAVTLSPPAVVDLT
jgi:NAD+ kinase